MTQNVLVLYQIGRPSARSCRFTRAIAGSLPSSNLRRSSPVVGYLESLISFDCVRERRRISARSSKGRPRRDAWHGKRIVVSAFSCRWDRFSRRLDAYRLRVSKFDGDRWCRPTFVFIARRDDLVLLDSVCRRSTTQNQEQQRTT